MGSSYTSSSTCSHGAAAGTSLPEAPAGTGWHPWGVLPPGARLLEGFQPAPGHLFKPDAFSDESPLTLPFVLHLPVEVGWPHAPESALFLGRPRGAPGTPVPISEKFGDAPACSLGLRLTLWFGKVGLASLVLTSKIRLYQCHLYVSKQIKCF